MRTILQTLAGLLGLGIACQSHFISVDAGSQEKKPLEKKPAAEIDKLVTDLGSPSFAVRQNAAKGLGHVPGALCRLRRHLADPSLDVEHRRRVQQVIDEIAKASFKRHFQVLAREKADAPLDLLVDFLLENRRYVTDDEWQGAMDVLNAIVAKHSDGIKKVNYAPISLCDYRKCQQVIGTNVVMIDDPRRFRLIADRVELGRLQSGNIVVLSGNLNSGFNLAQNALLMRGGVLKAQDAANKLGLLTSCFVFTGGDFSCSASFGSIVIAEGQIWIANPEKSVLIPKARQTSAVKWFSAERVGLILAEEGKNLRVQKVVRGSAAEECGLRSGDQIHGDDRTGSALKDLVSRIRTTYAGQAEMELDITRHGHLGKCVLSFCQ